MLSRKHVWMGLSACLGLTVLAAPSGVGAYKRWRDANRRATLHDFLRSTDAERQYRLSPAAQEEEAERGARGPHEVEWDEPFQRAIAWRNFYGPTSGTLASRWSSIAQSEARKWPHLMPRNGRSPKAAVNGLSWVNLGPTDAKFQYNGVRYTQVDSGRTTGIAVHPASNVAYTSTSGGGVWKTYDFDAADPTWYPVTETIGNLAVGAMAMDAASPDTLYIGLGDTFDVPGGQVLKTTSGGAFWSAPVQLEGAYAQSFGAFPVRAQRVRALALDPNNPNVVLAGTDVGLFRSTDAGASFELVDLPNAGDTQVAEAIWSIAYTGQAGGVSQWALSGVYAASEYVTHWGPGLGDATTPGDIWVSTDAGASWGSRKAAGALPDVPAGRIDLAAGKASLAGPGQTVLYAQVAADFEYAGAGLWRSLDSGQSWVDASGSLRNPTTAYDDCTSVNVNAEQAYYNQAIAVDPENDNHVIVGGQLCGLRTLNGTAAQPTWELVSHWLPTGGGGDTADGRLPYVHADWHTLRIVRHGSGYIAIAGTDGGLFVSRDVFKAGPVNETTVRWSFPNRGIVSHLFYSVASGDEVTGNGFVAFGGLQDNGTRFRDSKEAPTTFNQVIGGDGMGSTVAQVPGDTTYWASTQFRPRYCDPDIFDCNVGYAWFRRDPTQDGPAACEDDAIQFNTRLKNVPTATAETGTAVLHITDRAVYRLVGDPANFSNRWQLLGDPADEDGGGACSPLFNRDIMASATVDGLYGVPSSGGRFRVTSNCTLATSPEQCTWRFTFPLGVDLDGNAVLAEDERLFYTASIDFPPGPTVQPPGMEFVVSSVAPVTADGFTPVPDALGHVFRTLDGGFTWTPLKGNGTGFDLPNLPVNVLRYDPGDRTNQTLYAGTDLGLYRTTDGGQTWHRFGHGLPLVKVTDLFVSRTGAFLRAATYGRGLWELHPSATAEKGVSGNGDFDRNLQLDWVDLLSTSARMGTTPATQQVPFYDWNQDLTGSVNRIDDADLGGVLQRFGGRP